MKKLATSALVFAIALALFACGDDSSTSSGGGGSSANYAARKTREIAQKIGNALQTGDFSELEKYGIDAECARDDACMSIGIGRMLQEAGVGDIEPECLLDEECYGPWLDSVYGAADWTIFGDQLYDNACHVTTSEGICTEIAWNSALIDAEDVQDYKTACGTLDAFLPMGGSSVSASDVQVGRCPSRKILCTLESESETGWIEAKYGTSRAVCGDKIDDGKDDGGKDGKDYACGAGGTGKLADGAFFYEISSGSISCEEFYDSAEMVERLLQAGGAIWSAGRCPSEYAACCSLQENDDGSSRQIKYRNASIAACD